MPYKMLAIVCRADRPQPLGVRLYRQIGLTTAGGLDRGEGPKFSMYSFLNGNAACQFCYIIPMSLVKL